MRCYRYFLLQQQLGIIGIMKDRCSHSPRTVICIVAIALMGSATAAQQFPRAVNMIVAQDGSIYLDGKQAADGADLTNKLQILSARRPQPMIYVSGQPGVSATAVASAVNLCVSTGLVCPTGRMPRLPP